MYYTIYKTTNLVNGKFYIGKHQTKNLGDGYRGSGKLLTRAILKYGEENFVTTILEVFNEEWKMNVAERILVVLDREVSYNLCVGGQGGFGYINKNKLAPNIKDQDSDPSEAAKKANVRKRELWENNPEWRERYSKLRSDAMKGKKLWLGKRHTAESKNKMRKPHKFKSTNPHVGSYWLTDGTRNLKWNDSKGPPPYGFFRGRTC